jgi:dCTP deaminase
VFWSGNKLQEKLDSKFPVNKIVYYLDDPNKKPKVDCSSIELSVGPEGYITPENDDTEKNVIKMLDEKNRTLIIPKGQFGFILTEEHIKVPTEAMAFISFKATYKFQGLINVSGFHVDPGYHGRLIFSVYNAGPKDITLHRGDTFALIWFADLDDSATTEYSKDAVHKASQLNSISSKTINGITGDIFSPITLKNDFDTLKIDFDTLKNDLDKWKNGFISWLLGIALVLIIYMSRSAISNVIFGEEAKPEDKETSSIVILLEPLFSKNKAFLEESAAIAISSSLSGNDEQE